MAHITISKDVCLGSYLRLSDGAKALYFLLLILADREGFCDRTLPLRIGNHTEPELHELATGGYIIDLGNVIAIRHWYLHDPLARKMKHSTVFKDARNALTIKDWIYELKERAQDEENKGTIRDL